MSEYCRGLNTYQEYGPTFLAMVPYSQYSAYSCMSDCWQLEKAPMCIYIYVYIMLSFYIYTHTYVYSYSLRYLQKISKIYWASSLAARLLPPDASVRVCMRILVLEVQDWGVWDWFTDKLKQMDSGPKTRGPKNMVGI